jgi:outer membrane protein TolC
VNLVVFLDSPVIGLFLLIKAKLQIYKERTMAKHMIKIVISILISCIISAPACAEDAAELQLTVQDAISIVLSNNLGLKLERVTPDIKKENIAGAESDFDPVITASGTHSRLEAELETDDGSEDVESAENSIEAGIGKTYPYGTHLALNMTLKDDSNTTNSPDGNDGMSVLTALAVTQPLMKGKGSDINKRDIINAENEFKKAELSFRQTVIDTIAETKKLYWQLYSSTEQLKVQKESLLLAEQFLAEVEEKVKIGSAARLEILEAKAEVASREESLIRAEYKLMNSQDNLLSYIYGRLYQPRPVRCIQEPQFEEMVIHKDDLLQTALRLRSDYQAVDYDIASAEVDSSYFKNQKKAQLDVIGSLGYNKALSDEKNQPLSYQDYYTGEIALRLQFPWRFRRDEANYRTSMLSLRQSKIQRDTIESQIRLELRTAVRSVTSAHKQFQSAALAAQLAEEKLAAEQEKYKSGLSTSYNVLLFQRDWINAMVNRVDAIINYQLALVYLNKTAGITLEQNRVTIRDLH